MDTAGMFVLGFVCAVLSRFLMTRLDLWPYHDGDHGVTAVLVSVFGFVALPFLLVVAAERWLTTRLPPPKKPR